ncbi:hypothetical protein AB0383_09235 [Amycolatopsis sp. NPDC051373]|uniref:hypothetical protein n=1 Tax=Amycolatopsis sp. NPDC051373 TaxID=3155801 RepID=UPI00344C8B27
MVGVGTRGLDVPAGTVLSDFDDTHLVFAALSARDVPVHFARTIPELLDLIRQPRFGRAAGGVGAAREPQGGRLADLTVWPGDPLTRAVGELRALVPMHKVLGGRTIHGGS